MFLLSCFKAQIVYDDLTTPLHCDLIYVTRLSLRVKQTTKTHHNVLSYLKYQEECILKNLIMLSWITWYVFVRSDHIPDLEVSQPLAFSSGWNVRSDGQNLVSAQIFNKLFTVLVFLKYFYISVVESIFC